MSTAERIQRHIQHLPEPMQQEVLNFVEYLTQKLRQDDQDWSTLSIQSALRDLEDDVWPEYQDQDYREKWQ